MPSLSAINFGPTVASKPVVMNGELYFTATDGAHGTQLWESNGTTAGTQMLTNLNDKGGGLKPTDLTVVGGTLYFTANDGKDGPQLWKSDGTAAGTTMVTENNGGMPGYGFYASDLTVVNGSLYLSGWAPGEGYQVFRSDGTAAGTVPVTSLNGGGNADVSHLAAIGPTLYFQAYDSVDGFQLWALNTDSGATTMLTSGNAAKGGSYPVELTPVGNQLYFADTSSPTIGTQLWVTDGTTAGTAMLTNANPSGGGAQPSSITAMGGSVYFEGYTPAAGYQLWKTGGTPGTTAMLTDVNPGAGGLYPQDLTAVGGTLYFDGYGPGYGDQMWTSDGTAAGTQMVSEIDPTSGSLSCDYTVVGSTLYFAAYTPGTGYQVWQSDGTASGTVMDTNLAAPSAVAPADLVAMNGNLYFTAPGAGMWEWQSAASLSPSVPAITWNAPASIVYGTALGPAQLDATADVPGTFAYSPAAGTILPVGRQTLAVTFTPTDSVDYATATATIALSVAATAPVITWPTPASIAYGTALGPAQLDATADVAGTFAYAPPAGTVLGAGTQTLTATFYPTDTADYGSVTATATIVVTPATPPVTWGAPASVVYGTPLGAAQLDASSPVTGSFSYSLGTGSILPAGTQTLTATFMPADTADYLPVTVTTTITVAKATPTVGITDGGGTYDGSPFAASVVLTGVGGASGPGLEGVGPVVTYYAGSTPTGPALGGPPTGAGTYTAVASYAGSADYAGAAGPPVTFQIAPAGSQIVLVPHAVYRKKKVVALSLTAEVEPLAPGVGVPTGMVSFLVKKKNMGTISLSGGQATIALKPSSVLGKSITVTYGGDADFLPTSLTPSPTAGSPPAVREAERRWRAGRRG